MKHSAPALSLLGLLSLAAPPARGEARVEMVAAVIPTSGGRTITVGQAACPALFGDARRREHNAALRRHQLEWIDEDEGGVTVAHASECWRAPVRLRLDGIRLLGTRGGEATFQIAPALARAWGCTPGVYQVGVDASLSQHLRILGVLHRGVLVARGNRLGLVPLPGGDRGRWLLAWRMRGTAPASSSSGYGISGLIVD